MLRQHQATAVNKVVARALDRERARGLIWHTQGSGKTYTMIKAAELLLKAGEAKKPTILLMIDRNELEDQMLKNLAAMGVNNVAHANRMAMLNRLLDEKRQDYRGIVVTMIHKFRDMPEAGGSLRLGRALPSPPPLGTGTVLPLRMLSYKVGNHRRMTVRVHVCCGPSSA